MLIEYLRNIPLFRHLKEQQIKDIATRCRHKLFKKGEVVFYKTDQGTDLYIVLSGRLKAILTDQGGGEIVLAIFDKGAFFGELSLLDGRGRSATISADMDSELAVLSKTDFLELVSRDPRIAVELMITLVERLRKADELIESLAFMEVGERLTRVLLDLDRVGKDRERGYIVVRRLTHKELASRIGSSREAVSKCMKLLTVNGLIKESEDCVYIATDAIERLALVRKSVG